MVLDQMVTVERVITASDADFLAGTNLDQPGVPGVYTVFVVSDQVDTSVTITMGGRSITDQAIAVQRTGSIILEDSDVFFQMISRTGGRPVISIVEVTAAVIRVRVIFLPMASN